VTDLFVLVADSDAEALLGAVLKRPRLLDVRQITFDIRRLYSRDSGMVKEGPEIARMMVNKSDHSRLLLVWDHHGSGWDNRPTIDAACKIQDRLDGTTWSDRSAAIVLVPELEEWIWQHPLDLARPLGLNDAEFAQLLPAIPRHNDWVFERCTTDAPKELFGALVYHQKKRRPLPEDFERIGSTARLRRWNTSHSFQTFVNVLRKWFPIQS
jgi:hypothetical protein